MSVRTIDFLRPARPPRLAWLLLAAGLLAAGLDFRLEQRLDDARVRRDLAQAEREAAEAQARDHLAIAARPTPETRRLAGAASELARPWLPTLRSVEAATLPPVYVLDLAVDPVKGRVHLEGEAPDFEQAVAYVERLGASGALVRARLVSHEQAQDPATGQSVVKFTVEADWGRSP